MHTNGNVLFKIPPTKILSGFWFMQRDLEILKAVYRYRLMIRSQIERLLFSSSSDQVPKDTRAKTRLRLLTQHRYLNQIIRPTYSSEGSKPLIYRLALKSAQLFAQYTGIPFNQFNYWRKRDDLKKRKTKVRDWFLEHGLALTDIRIAIDQAVVKNGFSIEEERDDFDFKTAQDWDRVKITFPGKGLEEVRINPDYLMRLRTPKGKAHFFLEVDRSTETISKTWQKKILGYKKFILSGDFTKRYGGSRSLRILTTTPSLERAQNLAKAAETYGPKEASQIFWFATKDDVTTKDPLTFPIWLRAGETTKRAIV